MIAAPATPRQAQARRPLTALRPGELVTAHLRGRAVDAVNAYSGEVLASDATALRLAAAWSRFGLTPSAAEGEVVIPSSRIDRVRVEAPR